MFIALTLSMSFALPQEGGDTNLPPVACFAEGTSEAYMQEVQSALGPPPEFNLGSRWSGGQGNPRVITWSLVPDTVFVTSTGQNSELFSRMNAIYGNQATWVNRFQQCFDRWEEITGIDFVRRTSGGNDWDDGAGWGSSGNNNRGDIRIAMTSIDGNFGTLAFASFPGGGSGGNMVFDRAENWGSGANQNRFLRNVIMHETGHAIGIAHVCSNNSSQLMEPALLTNIDGPRQDDIRAGQRHYGDPFEGNNNSGQAHDIGELDGFLSFGVLPPPQTGSNDGGSAWLSIDANGEVDYYRFTITASSLVDATLIPVGGNYQNEGQNGDGSCPSGGNQTNGRFVKNLGFEIIAPNGSTVLATADSEPEGVNEELTGVLLDPPGQYFVRVFDDGGANSSQLYRFELSSTSTATTFCDQTDGSLAACPCGNVGDPVSGCDIAQGTGGVSVTVISQETSPQNRVTMRAAGFPPSTSPSAVVIRSNGLETSGVVFGDGVRCVGVPLVRLGATAAFLGFSDHTFGHGTGAGSGEFYYQVWFRNTPGSFCTPSAFNLSNGRALSW